MAIAATCVFVQRKGKRLSQMKKNGAKTVLFLW
jgi:4-hydroxy-3-methylbut-2-enyl diphosphate reductase IspH